MSYSCRYLRLQFQRVTYMNILVFLRFLRYLFKLRQKMFSFSKSFFCFTLFLFLEELFLENLRSIVKGFISVGKMLF